jgi:hypothetical protein
MVKIFNPAISTRAHLLPGYRAACVPVRARLLPELFFEKLLDIV